MIAMLSVTTFASLDRSILKLGDQLLHDPWFLATLCDAYCGFLIFYVWVAYKEQSALSRVIWFVLIMGLGNIATAVYLLREVWRVRNSNDPRELLLRRESAVP